MKFKLLFSILSLGFIGSLYTMEETFIIHETPNEMLIMGAEEGDIRLVLKALKNKADVNYQNRYGYTALHKAIVNGSVYIVKLLLNNGANPDIQDNNGDTALMNAAFFAKEDIAKLLLENDASLDLKNSEGETALDIVKKEEYRYRSRRRYLAMIDLIENEHARREKFRNDVYKEITDKYLLPDLADIVLELAEIVSEYAVCPKEKRTL